LTGTGIRLKALALTAQQAIDRLQATASAPLRNDGIKAGDSATPVTGIFVTAMATVDVLRRAAASHHNLVITHEPVFYSANDAAGPRASDPVYLAKQQLIDDERLVVYRLVDQWSARPENTSADELAAMFGWKRSQTPPDHVYDIGNTTLGALANARRSPGQRMVGPASLTVRRVFVSPGTTTLPAVIAGLRRADAVIAGEPREWEAVPYVLDTAAAGQPKGMLLLGRIVSEDPGLRKCAEWIRNVVPEVPVEHHPFADPYWNPR
jgi:hypothetical protein